MKITIYKEPIDVDIVNKIRGLMWKDSIEKPVILLNCKSIHTFFMLFNIDAYFLDKNFNVIEKVLNIKPNKIIISPPNTKHVVELMSKKR